MSIVDQDFESICSPVRSRPIAVKSCFRQQDKGPLQPDEMGTGGRVYYSTMERSGKRQVTPRGEAHQPNRRHDKKPTTKLVRRAK